MGCQGASLGGKEENAASIRSQEVPHLRVTRPDTERAEGGSACRVTSPH